MSVNIEEAIRMAGAWLNIEGVEIVAHGERDGKDCIQVYVSRQEAARDLPETYVGYPVVVQFTDKILAQERPKPKIVGDG
jgi:hypothetical protein